jgi:Cu(I)/Ag(I) efflux system membrane fusion protein
MKKIACLSAVLLLTFTAAAFAKGYELQKKAGDYTFDIKMDKNPPVMGNNVMEIAIKDAAGKAVTDAAVSVAYTMPPMQGMAPMNYKSNAELQGEAYRSTLNFSMSGPWNVEVRAVRAGKTTPVKFNVDVK